jgi:flagellin FlaA/flagellin FlaB
MFDMERESERAQVGIGTLIVFIAMVLVAAIAAGVLINTAGFLQSQSQATGQQSSKQVSDRLQEVVTTGLVDSGNNEIRAVNVTVTQAPGAGEIDLQNATVSWVGEGDSYTYVYGENDASASTEPSLSGADEYFTVEVVRNEGDSSTGVTVLNDADDRFTLNFALANPSGTTGEIQAADKLIEGEEVTIKINTQAGGTTTIRFTVPESLDDKSSVLL